MLAGERQAGFWTSKRGAMAGIAQKPLLIKVSPTNPLSEVFDIFLSPFCLHSVSKLSPMTALGDKSETKIRETENGDRNHQG